jgi:hypothetical protein
MYARGPTNEENILSYVVNRAPEEKSQWMQEKNCPRSPKVDHKAAVKEAK